MRCFITLVSAFLVLVPLFSFAGWQVATPRTAMPTEPFFRAGIEQNPVYTPPVYNAVSLPNKFANLGRPAAVYAISISGSIKENIERIMERYHWRVVWKAPFDYNFDGRVCGSSLPNVIQKLLKPFPLQGKMFMSNRTLLVTERTP